MKEYPFCYYYKKFPYKEDDLIYKKFVEEKEEEEHNKQDATPNNDKWMHPFVVVSTPLSCILERERIFTQLKEL